MLNNILLLASQSKSRRDLLAESGIPFVLLDQDANESACDWLLPMPQLVASIARHKMEQVIMPKGQEGGKAFVLTADTLTLAHNNEILPKPYTILNAKRMLALIRKGAVVGTAFCLDRKVFKFGSWHLEERIEQYIEATCVYDVPLEDIDDYLKNTSALRNSGSIAVEGYGTQFFKELDGSYTTILGLPLFEVRQALEKIGFYSY